MSKRSDQQLGQLTELASYVTLSCQYYFYTVSNFLSQDSCYCAWALKPPFLFPGSATDVVWPLAIGQVLLECMAPLLVIGGCGGCGNSCHAVWSIVWWIPMQ